MLKSSATTLDNATRIVLQYKLDKVAWPNGGSPAGLSRWLFLAGGELTVQQISHEITAYKLDCAKAPEDGESREDRLRIDAESYTAGLDEVTRARQRFAKLIRNTKLSPLGGCLWNVAASLATTPHPHLGLQAVEQQGLLLPLAELLKSLRQFASDFFHCDPSVYVPGEDAEMDYLLRLDIERLDETLVEVPDWLGSESEVWPEISALLRLASDTTLSVAVATAKGKALKSRTSA